MTTPNDYPETGQLAPAPERTLLLTNVRPYGEGEPLDVFISDGTITAIGEDTKNYSADDVIDGEGNVLLPGLVDMHVHLREPGREDTETIATGSAAAAKGGFTAVLLWPIRFQFWTSRLSRNLFGLNRNRSDYAMCTLLAQ